MKIDSIVSGMSLTWTYVHRIAIFHTITLISPTIFENHVKSSKLCEIRQKFELMQFKVISLGVSQKRIFNSY